MPRGTPPSGRRPSVRRTQFDPEAFLASTGVQRRIVDFRPEASVFRQGDPATQVYYVQDGGIRLSVTSHTGREAVIATLGHGDFFGEGCLAGQAVRMGSATATTTTSVLVIEKPRMVRMLRQEPELADRFLAYVLGRNIRFEEDLVDQLFNSSERRLARALLLLARYGKDALPMRTIPRPTQEILAAMIGTTRSRVNFFMNKFRRLGFIEYDGGIRINTSLLSVVLHD